MGVVRLWYCCVQDVWCVCVCVCMHVKALYPLPSLFTLHLHPFPFRLCMCVCVCVCVCVTGNNIGDAGASALAPVLAQMKQLTVLDLGSE